MERQKYRLYYRDPHIREFFDHGDYVHFALVVTEFDAGSAEEAERMVGEKIVHRSVSLDGVRYDAVPVRLTAVSETTLKAWPADPDEADPE